MDVERGRALAASGIYAAPETKSSEDFDDVPLQDEPPAEGFAVEVPRLWRATDLNPAAQPKWLARHRLPKSAISLLIGDEGIGKSLHWVYLAAAITTGKAVPEFGIPAREPADVIVIATEDDWCSTVRPRLEVAGADLSRITVMCIERDGSGSPTFPLHMPILREAEPAALIVVDAWLDTLPSGVQVRDPQQARAALHPWKDLATTTGAAVLLICHTNRSHTANARDRYGATGALRQKARMTLFAQLDDEGYLTVGPEKSNGSAPIPASRFTITPVQAFAATDDSDGTVPLLTYAGESALTARQHLAASADAGEDGDHSDVDEWLTALLADGPVKATEVYSAADAAGHSKDKAKRAKKRLGVEAVKDGNGPWRWSLSKGAAAPPSQNARSLAPLHSLQVSTGNQGCASEQEGKGAPEMDTGTTRTLAPIPLPTGPDRCGQCGFHTPTQGHRAGCQQTGGV
jgi:hypothetical protein